MKYYTRQVESTRIHVMRQNLNLSKVFAVNSLDILQLSAQNKSVGIKMPQHFLQNEHSTFKRGERNMIQV